MKIKNPTGTSIVNILDVACDGTLDDKTMDKSLGHPKIYLKINPQTNTIMCPYCGHTFILKNEQKDK